MTFYSTPLARKVIGCAIEVHRQLGPGLLESTYDQCFAHELSASEFSFVREASLPLRYKGIKLDWGYRVDYLIEGELLVELKAIAKVLPIHRAQALTYLKLLDVPQALIINFNVQRLVEGVTSIVLSSRQQPRSRE